MKISLESYAPVAVVDNFDEIILDQVAANEAFLEASAELDKVMTSIEIYSEIGRTIQVCGGVTKSIEVMFGENFSSTASMEAEVMASIKSGFKKAWEWLKKMFGKIADFFRTLFSTTEGAKKRFAEAIAALKANKKLSKVDVELPEGLVKINNLYPIIDLADQATKLFPALNKALDILSKVKAKDVDDEKKINSIGSKIEKIGELKTVKKQLEELENKANALAMAFAGKQTTKITDKAELIDIFTKGKDFVDKYNNVFGVVKNGCKELASKMAQIESVLREADKGTVAEVIAAYRAALRLQSFIMFKPTWFIRKAAVEAQRIVTNVANTEATAEPAAK
jgi:hypothetical protein